MSKWTYFLRIRHTTPCASNRCLLAYSIELSLFILDARNADCNTNIFLFQSKKPIEKFVVCQWLTTGRWISSGIPVSSTNKTDCHDIAEILLKVTLNTIKPNQKTKPLQFVKINLCASYGFIPALCNLIKI